MSISQRRPIMRNSLKGIISMTFVMSEIKDGKVCMAEMSVFIAEDSLVIWAARSELSEELVRG